MKPDDWIMLALNRQIESSFYIPTDDTGLIQMHFKSLNTDGTTIDIGQDAVLAVIDLYIEEFMDQVDSVCSKSVEYIKSGKRNFSISDSQRTTHLIFGVAFRMHTVKKEFIWFQKWCIWIFRTKVQFTMGTVIGQGLN